MIRNSSNIRLRFVREALQVNSSGAGRIRAISMSKIRNTSEIK